ncbi:Bug family tripartite tricarboxylate transporter substrate binding protein [Pseudorhodoferax sp.]|uniref:Bug family tripartite tricarboxylate transporter substrate binding protein n=1 Tax=Pseudorhodoferax sp. TaxID=1993553 RepID=UPI002DD68226|nr:tripartite tricarboxylate transporter substrate binding protein [Pseudorhodoferax sp.]
MIRRRSVLSLPAAMALGPAHAQAYPDRPLNWVVGFPAGGSADMIGRRLTDRFAQEVGQPVVVLNKPGAGGTLATDYVASQAADGYTILGAGATTCVAEALYKNLRSRLFRDVQLIAVTGVTSNVLVMSAASPITSIEALIAYAKANPGKLTYASTGNGTTPHLCAEMFKATAQVDLVHVPYKGSGQALTDLVSRRVDLMFDNVATAMPFVNSGELRAFAVTASNPNPIAPGIPTLREAGIALAVDSWSGASVSSRTPLEIRQWLNQKLRAMARDPAYVQSMKGLGVAVNQNDWDLPAVDAYVKQEMEFWRKAVALSGAVVS